MELNKKKIRLILTIGFFTLASIVALVAFKDFIFEPIVHPIAKIAQKIEYGIVTDSFKIDRDEVKSGDNLGEIFTRLGVDQKIVGNLNTYTDGIFDIRKLRTGNTYTAMMSNNAGNKLMYFVYTINDTSYVIFDFRDSLHVHTDSKEVVRSLKSVSGSINSSLWTTMQEAGADPNLAVALANIYQWSIDFYSIQKGDSFKAIYEELSVDGKPISIGEIHSAVFSHNGKEFFAYRFEQGNITDYFDENGQNLRKEFLKAPLKFSRITSKFSNSRMHPILRIRRPHHGVDYAAPKGTPVHTIGNGTVVKAAYSGGAGRLVMIRHNNGYSTSYMHLAGFGPGIHTGASVSQGQVIGYVGSSGLSTGAHLDFRVYKNNVAMDPLKIESPPALPVNIKYKANFDSVKVLYAKNLKLVK
ncbi:MAG: peptidoglycan DD-metalloendopeptidase family protein [Bacteroidales bacterium]|nr:peptidoglycan DD-metalloendopeptidase family protein [Bacteroidales bacterium]